jgi:hypothetical protein
VTNTVKTAAAEVIGATSAGAGSAGSSGLGSSGVAATVGRASSSAAGGVGGSSSPGGSADPSARSVRVEHFRSPRAWIGTRGPEQRRTTTLIFKLTRAQRVVLTVTQVSPACVGIGHLSVRGHAGLNRLRFAGRVHGRRLPPGTYRTSIHTASGRVVRSLTLVVVDGSAPGRQELATLRAANTCPVEALAGGTTFGTATPLAASQASQGSLSNPQQGWISTPHEPNLHEGVLGSTVDKTARAIRPLLVALLAMSIVLLGAPRSRASPSRTGA